MLLLKKRKKEIKIRTIVFRITIWQSVGQISANLVHGLPTCSFKMNAQLGLIFILRKQTVKMMYYLSRHADAIFIRKQHVLQQTMADVF